MKSVLTWAGLSAGILLAALLLQSLPDHQQGGWLLLVAFLVTGLMLLRICRGSQ